MRICAYNRRWSQPGGGLVLRRGEESPDFVERGAHMSRKARWDGVTRWKVPQKQTARKGKGEIVR